MCRIKFHVESLETFCPWKVVKYVKNADLEIIGHVGPLRSMTVKPINSVLPVHLKKFRTKKILTISNDQKRCWKTGFVPNIYPD